MRETVVVPYSPSLQRCQKGLWGRAQPVLKTSTGANLSYTACRPDKVAKCPTIQRTALLSEGLLENNFLFQGWGTTFPFWATFRGTHSHCGQGLRQKWEDFTSVQQASLFSFCRKREALSNVSRTHSSMAKALEERWGAVAIKSVTQGEWTWPEGPDLTPDGQRESPGELRPASGSELSCP